MEIICFRARNARLALINAKPILPGMGYSKTFLMDLYKGMVTNFLFVFFKIMY